MPTKGSPSSAGPDGSAAPHPIQQDSITPHRSSPSEEKPQQRIMGEDGGNLSPLPSPDPVLVHSRAPQGEWPPPPYAPPDRDIITDPCELPKPQPLPSPVRSPSCVSQYENLREEAPSATDPHLRIPKRGVPSVQSSPHLPIRDTSSPQMPKSKSLSF